MPVNYINNRVDEYWVKEFTGARLNVPRNVGMQSLKENATASLMGEVPLRGQGAEERWPEPM